MSSWYMFWDKFDAWTASDPLLFDIPVVIVFLGMIYICGYNNGKRKNKVKK